MATRNVNLSDTARIVALYEQYFTVIRLHARELFREFVHVKYNEEVVAHSRLSLMNRLFSKKPNEISAILGIKTLDALPYMWSFDEVIEWASEHIGGDYRKPIYISDFIPDKHPYCLIEKSHHIFEHLVGKNILTGNIGTAEVVLDENEYLAITSMKEACELWEANPW